MGDTFDSDVIPPEAELGGKNKKKKTTQANKEKKIPLRLRRNQIWKLRVNKQSVIPIIHSHRNHEICFTSQNHSAVFFCRWWWWVD